MKRSVFLMNVLFTLVPLVSLAQPQITPLPAQFSKAKGSFTLNNNVSLVFEDAGLKDEAHYFQKELLTRKGLVIALADKRKNHSIVLSLNKKTSKIAGSYSLNISPGSVMISAGTEEGVFNGLVSLLQLVATGENRNGDVLLDCWDITDAPKYQWRGLMLDESRHFFGKEKVKSLLDWMAFYKLNKFHWHLTDEPGWRVEIKKYPLLALVGGIGNYSDMFAKPTYYTQQDISEIVSYAAERKIDIIPEIDMPGHARAANRAYPQFSGGGSAKYPDFTFDPGNTATYGFLTDILKEVNVLFPSQMVHLGGDEVSFGNEKWNTNAGIKDLMQSHGLKDLKDVEEYFMKRMADSVYKLNSRVLVWDEMANAPLPASKTIIFWWRHDKPEQLQTALDNNFPVVVCPRIPFYFDFVQDSTHNTGRKWKGAFSGLRNVYDFDVKDFVKDNKKSDRILGVQANVWTEQIVSAQRLGYMIFPRISALAETAWSAKKDYQHFLKRLKNHLPIYKEHGIFYFDPFDANKPAEPRR